MNEVRLTHSLTKWVGVSTLGLAGGLIVSRMVGAALAPHASATVVTFVVTCIVGLVLGAFQTAALRSLEVSSFWWIVATFVGVGVGMALGVVVVERLATLLTGKPPDIQYLTPAPRALCFLVLGLVAGLVAGGAQALVLRSAGWAADQWTVMSGIALGTAFGVSSLLLDYSGYSLGSTVGGAAFVLLSGLCYGMPTSRLLGRVEADGEPAEDQLAVEQG